MARRRNSKAHMAYVRSFRKSARKASPRRKSRRKARRNPYPAAGMVLANPRRKKSYRRNKTRSYHRKRHSYSRNPRIMGIELPPFNKVLFAGAGFVVPPMIEGIISPYIPASIQNNTFGRYAIRAASVLALTFGVKRFIGKSEGDMVLVGGGVYIATTAIREFFPQLLGSAASGFAPATALPAAKPAGVSAYVNAAPGQLRQYVPANQRVNNTLGLPSAAFTNRESSGAYGGTAVRFKRF